MTLDLFHIIEDGAVILVRKGIYRQAKVFHRSDWIYAQIGSGFIRLLAHDGTTDPSTKWIGVDAEGVTALAHNAPTWSEQCA